MISGCFAVIAVLTLLLFFCCGCGGTTADGTTDDNTTNGDITDLELTPEEVEKMTPYSITLSFLNKEEDKNDYGITWSLEDDSKNTSGENYVEIIKKTGDGEPSEELFVQAEKIAAVRRAEGEYIYCKADVCGLESGTEYYWRCGNALGIYSEISTLTVPESIGEEFTFLHFSDTQNEEGYSPNRYYHKAVASAVKAADIDFILHTGDMVQLGREDDLWREMLDSPVLRSTPVMPLSGNHEYWNTYGLHDGLNETCRHYNITLPAQDVKNGMYYSFDRGSCHFIMLNAGDIADGMLWQEQLEWLKKDLSESQAKWTIVGIHEPLYSLGKYGSKPEVNANALLMQRELQPILTGRVDLVLQGHDHMVQYTFPLDKDGNVISKSAVRVEAEDGTGYDRYSLSGGVLYLMSGTAGNQNRNSELYLGIDDKFAFYFERDKEQTVATDKLPTYSQITVKKDEIVVRINGFSQNSSKPRQIAEFAITK